ncbi:MAG: hypothetical protein QGF67_00330 [Lentisphaeria bacterium]|jgi:hypothetical protein|nr:hypothetical protein [Lentisphaeria bacterium]
MKQISRPHVLVYLLFVSPSVLAVLQHKRLLSAALLVLTVCLLSSACTSVPVIMKSRYVMDGVYDWFQAEVADVRLTNDGELRWREPDVLPHTDTVRGCRIDFSTADEMPPTSDFQPAPYGIWIGATDVKLWHLPQGSEKPIIVSLRTVLALMQAFNDGHPAAAPGEILDSQVSEGMQILRKTVSIGIVVVLFLRAWAMTLIMPLSAVFAVALCSVFARSRRPIRQIVVLYLYSAIPPLLIASTYEVLFGISFFYVFCFAFLLYHLYVIRSLRLLGLDPDQGGEK